MRRAWPLLRWAVVVVPVMDAALALGGLLSARTAVVAGVALEVVLGAVVAAEMLAFRRGYRSSRDAGGPRAAAASAGLAAALPGPVVWFLRAEAGTARALWAAVRRRRDVGPEDVPLPYADRIGVMLWTTVGLGVLESAVVHLLVPWPTLRWLLLALSVYGLLWVVGLACSLRQHPHVLRDGELLLRFAHLRTTRVPLAGLVTARRDVRTGHRHNVERLGVTLSLSVAGETSVELVFDPPVEVEVRGHAERHARVRFFADDPRAAVRVLGERGVSARR
jgi:hypothetical protein